MFLPKSSLLSLFAHFATLTNALPKVSDQRLWQPAVGSKWQIMIKNNISIALNQPLAPTEVGIWDIDLFNTPVDIIQGLHAMGDKVICYFSAGSGEDWRPDYSQIPSQDLGEDLGCWPGEKWLNIRSEAVWNVMAKRITLAASKGCDGVDPDNMDGYSNGGGGFSLTEQDSINYINKISAEAASYGMSTGLKNAQEILDRVTSNVQFAVNEQCASGGDCSSYDGFLEAGKPVFHIEYADYSISSSGSVALSSNGMSTEQIRALSCLETGNKDVKNGTLPQQAQNGTLLQPAQNGTLSQHAHAKKLGRNSFSTVIKGLLLDGFVYYCDKDWAVSKTMDVGTGGPSSGYCDKKKKGL